MRKELLSIIHAHKTLNGIHCLSDVSFHICEDEMVGLVGLNVSGKNHLIRAILGEEPLDSGTITLDGTPICFSDRMAARRNGIYCIRKQSELLPDLTIAENINITRSRRSGFLIQREVEWASAQKVLDILDLPFSPGIRCHSLTNAEKHMIQIAKAVASFCRLIVFDDLTSAYTNDEFLAFSKVIELLRLKGIAIIFASQRLEQILALSDRIYVMRNDRYAGQLFQSDYSGERLLGMMTGYVHDELFAFQRPINTPKELLRISGLNGSHFQNVSFTLHEHEILGITDIADSSFSEKVLALFMDQLHCFSGNVYYCGEPISSRDIRMALKKHRIGIVASNTNYCDLFPTLTLSENLNFLALPHIANRFGLIDPSVSHYIDTEEQRALGLPCESYQKTVQALELSTFETLLIVLQKWMRQNPAVLFLLNVTDGLDTVAQKRIWEVLRKLNDNGTSLILISSDMTELMALSNSILFLERGVPISEKVNIGEISR